MEVDSYGDFIGTKFDFFKDIVKEIVEIVIKSDEENLVENYQNKSDCFFGSSKLIMNLKKQKPE